MNSNTHGLTLVSQMQQPSKVATSYIKMTVYVSAINHNRLFILRNYFTQRGGIEDSEVELDKSFRIKTST